MGDPEVHRRALPHVRRNRRFIHGLPAGHQRLSRRCRLASARTVRGMTRAPVMAWRQLLTRHGLGNDTIRRQLAALAFLNAYLGGGATASSPTWRAQARGASAARVRGTCTVMVTAPPVSPGRGGSRASPRDAQLWWEPLAKHPKHRNHLLLQGILSTKHPCKHPLPHALLRGVPTKTSPPHGCVAPASRTTPAADLSIPPSGLVGCTPAGGVPGVSGVLFQPNEPADVPHASSDVHILPSPR
jgi:hypothetical protein